ncbi:sensor histidine kinase [Acrocarpospora catenulata]|uniref:sensor histidine kinase n=1 Tax=Acrocarpospora catenulata TaxID=2836182 RepID=UPI001BD94C36|nr:hypothetical protein [Acrocarpospora catenulata]
MNMVIVAAGVLLVVLVVVRTVYRRRAEDLNERWVTERVEGTLGADGRRLADMAILVERARQAGVAARLHVSGAPAKLPAEVDLAGYRIIQEALMNAIEHGVSTATVTIAYRANALVIDVDTPIGSRPTRYSGAKRMRARATPLGGSVKSRPYGDGWRVSANFPIVLEPS